MISLQTKLKARRFIRASGGYGYAGFLKAYFKVCVIGAATLMTLLFVQLSLCDWEGACLQNPSDDLVTVITAVLWLCAGALFVRQCVVLPIANSVWITPELTELAADFDDPEAALSLSELHGQRGADAHATIWWERATALEHPATKKNRKIQKKERT